MKIALVAAAAGSLMETPTQATATAKGKTVARVVATRELTVPAALETMAEGTAPGVLVVQESQQPLEIAQGGCPWGSKLFILRMP